VSSHAGWPLDDVSFGKESDPDERGGRSRKSPENQARGTIDVHPSVRRVEAAAQVQTPLRHRGPMLPAALLRVGAEGRGSGCEPVRYDLAVLPQGAQPSEPGLGSYLSAFWRRKWVVALCIVLGVGAALAYVFLSTPKYTATAEVLLEPSPTTNSIGGTASQALNAAEVQTRIQLITSQPVKAAVARQLHVSSAPASSVAAIGVTDVVSVSVTTTNARMAASAANAYANSYITYQQQATVAFLVDAAQQIQAKINSTDQQIAAMGPSSSAAPNPARDALAAQEAAFRAQLSNLDVDTAFASGGAQLITPAMTPGSPSAPKLKKDVAIGGGLGVVFGLVLAAALEYVDDSIRTKEDLDVVTPGTPSLALVPEVSDWRDRHATVLVSVTSPRSPAAEAYRTLRTGLQFMAIERPLGLVQVTSASASEGKTTTLANLAVAMAEAGKRVVAVDCDLRRPRIHDFFGLSNDRGFTSVLVGEVDLDQAVQAVPSAPGLHVLASGKPPPNPSEILSSPAAWHVLARLKEQYDIVLIDTPPILPVTDASVVASRVDGTVLVVRAGRTTRRELHRAVELLDQVGANIVGTLLNSLEQPGRYGYPYRYYRYSRYGYGYGYGYSSSRRGDRDDAAESVPRR